LDREWACGSGEGKDGNEFWFQLTTNSPTAMVGVDFDRDGEVEAGVFTFPGQGLWLYERGQ
jgi:hypothetical protein